MHGCPIVSAKSSVLSWSSTVKCEVVWPAKQNFAAVCLPVSGLACNCRRALKPYKLVYCKRQARKYLTGYVLLCGLFTAAACCSKANPQPTNILDFQVLLVKHPLAIIYCFWVCLDTKTRKVGLLLLDSSWFEWWIEFGILSLAGTELCYIVGARAALLLVCTWSSGQLVVSALCHLFNVETSTASQRYFL